MENIRIFISTKRILTDYEGCKNFTQSVSSNILYPEQKAKNANGRDVYSDPGRFVVRIAECYGNAAVYSGHTKTAGSYGQALYKRSMPAIWYNGFL